jgi:hypothetical protein
MDDQMHQPPASTEGATPDLPDTVPAPSPTRDPALKQLDAIIENVRSYATPVLREIAARAAELAAKAGQAAGPMAQKAATKTGEVGDIVAMKGRALASDLRAEAAPPAEAAAGANATDGGDLRSDDLAPAS